MSVTRTSENLVVDYESGEVEVDTSRGSVTIYLKRTGNATSKGQHLKLTKVSKDLNSMAVVAMGDSKIDRKYTIVTGSNLKFKTNGQDWFGVE